jgi:hypothetical protein
MIGYRKAKNNDTLLTEIDTHLQEVLASENGDLFEFINGASSKTVKAIVGEFYEEKGIEGAGTKKRKRSIKKAVPVKRRNVNQGGNERK